MDCENTQPGDLPIHPRTGLTAVGVLPSGRIVWPIMGASSDHNPEGDDDDGGDDGGDGDGDSDDGDGDDGDGDDGGEGDGDNKPKPKKSGDTVPRAELAKVIAARDKAKKEARDATRALEELQRTSETADEAARREAAEESRKTTEARYKPISVKAALLEAGVIPGRVKGAIRLVNLDDVEIDEEGEVSGLDSQIEDLKRDWAELFAAPETEPKKPEPKRGGADGADKKPTPKKELTASERQAARLLGKAS